MWPYRHNWSSELKIFEIKIRFIFLHSSSLKTQTFVLHWNFHRTQSWIFFLFGGKFVNACSVFSISTRNLIWRHALCSFWSTSVRYGLFINYKFFPSFPKILNLVIINQAVHFLVSFVIKYLPVFWKRPRVYDTNLSSQALPAILFPL